MLVLGTSIAILALIPWFLETYFFRKNLLLYAWWFLLPLSLAVSMGSSRLNIPSELILILWLSLPLLRGFPKGMPMVLRHPVSILLMVELLLYFLATLHSSMPSVSLKRFALHTAYITGAYFLIVPLFLQRKNIIKMTAFIGLGLLPVLAMALIFFQGYHFNSEVAPEAPRPFFSDHTQFGAFAALQLPLTFVLIRYGKRFNLKPALWQKILLAVTIACVSFSFSRAVWMSVAAMSVLYILLLLKTPFRVIVFLLIVSSGILYSYQNEIYQTVLQNEAESDRQEILQQLESVGNIKTDVSNLERINRWKAALKMSAKEPLLGFGPGTYQFQYAPYQELRDKTVISTNFGDAGNAHSEFLMYLSETGVFGFLIFLALCFYLLHTGFRLTYKGVEPITRYLAMGLLLGLSGFLVHSLVNSFLETDKIGLLFYFFVAAMVAVDLRDRQYKFS